MANLTLVIDDDVLRRARKRALDEGTSVNAVVREQLEVYAGENKEAAAAMQSFLDWAETVDAGSGPSGRTWTREDAYDRPAFRDRS